MGSITQGHGGLFQTSGIGALSGYSQGDPGHAILRAWFPFLLPAPGSVQIRPEMCQQAAHLMHSSLSGLSRGSTASGKEGLGCVHVGIHAGWGSNC